MRRMMALITAVTVLCAGCGGNHGKSMPDTRAATAAVEDWEDRGGWEGEGLERQRRLVRWYGLNLQSEQPDSGFQKGYDNILAGPGGIMGWVEFPQAGAVLPLLHDGCAGEGFWHQRNTPFPVGEGGTSVLRLRCEEAVLWAAWLAPEAGDVFRIHILDQVITYRIQSAEAGGEIDFPVAGDDRCVLIFDTEGEGIIVLGVPENP